MSASAHAPGRWCGAHRAARWNCSRSWGHASQKSSEIRHIWAWARSVSRCARDSSLPGDRLSVMGRPVLSIAAEIAAISRSSMGG